MNLFHRRTKTERVTEPAATGLEKVRGKAAEAASTLPPRAKTAADSARRTLAPKVEVARDNVAHFAADRVLPTASDIVERAQEALTATVIPAVTAAIESAYDASEPAREEAIRRGSAAWHALRGEPVYVRRKRRWPVAIVFLLIGGAAGAAAGILADRRSGTSSTGPIAVARETPMESESTTPAQDRTIDLTAGTESTAHTPPH